MRRLREDGIDKVLEGVTSIEEVARVIGSDRIAVGEGDDAHGSWFDILLEVLERRRVATCT